MTICNQTVENRKQKQQASIRRPQRRHNNSISNRGVYSISTIDTPAIYSVIIDAMVSTSKRCISPPLGSFYLFLDQCPLKHTPLIDSMHWLLRKSSPSLRIGHFYIQPKIEERETLLSAASGNNFTGSVVLIL